jgi:hypothetical protein
MTTSSAAEQTQYIEKKLDIDPETTQAATGKDESRLSSFFNRASREVNKLESAGKYSAAFLTIAATAFALSYPVVGGIATYLAISKAIDYHQATHGLNTVRQDLIATAEVNRTQKNEPKI